MNFAFSAVDETLRWQPSGHLCTDVNFVYLTAIVPFVA